MWTRGGEEAPSTLYFEYVDEFVREYLIHHYKRPSPTAAHQRCGHRNGGATKKRSTDQKISRRAWDFLRLDPSTGMSLWWRDHAEHHIVTLPGPGGPFRGASGKSDRGEPLPYTAHPAGFFSNICEG
ncbi:DUF4913 domain-containing protein [Sanguibacter biliveldensis]|uniref:DUF4913 domain-containing protein n=1 Tax=Sanguibacter biliveldensis TaxID=3030830 RepID=UPI0038CD7376